MGDCLFFFFVYAKYCDTVQGKTKKIEIKEQGAVCVEMEGACIAAVCKYRNLDYIGYISDEKQKKI